MNFSKKHTYILKGIATIMLLVHHLFSNNAYATVYSISYFPLNQSFVIMISVLCRSCLHLFSFLTGYGLSVIYEKEKSKENKINPVAFVISRVKKLLVSYWYVFVPSYAVYFFFFNLKEIYGTEKSILLASIGDFFGVSFFFKYQSINTTWWYMSLAILFIILFPTLHFFNKKAKYFSLFLVYAVMQLSFIPDYFLDYYLMFILTMMTGDFFHQFRIFEVTQKLKWTLKNLFIVCLGIGFLLFLRYYGFFSRIIGTILTVFISLAVYKINISYCIDFKILEIIGKHSHNIYFVHYFYCATQLSIFIYIFHNWLAILFFLLLLCMASSYLIEKFKIFFEF